MIGGYYVYSRINQLLYSKGCEGDNIGTVVRTSPSGDTLAQNVQNNTGIMVVQYNDHNVHATARRPIARASFRSEVVKETMAEVTSVPP